MGLTVFTISFHHDLVSISMDAQNIFMTLHPQTVIYPVVIHLFNPSYFKIQTHLVILNQFDEKIASKYIQYWSD
jgi:hypothetical protein